MFAVESFMIGMALLLMVTLCGIGCIIREFVSLTPPFVTRYRAINAYRESLREFEKAKADGEEKVMAQVGTFFLNPVNVPVDDAIAGAKKGIERASKLRYIFIPYC